MSAETYALHPINPYGMWLHIATDLTQWKAIRGTVRKIPKRPESLGLTVMCTEVTPQDRYVRHVVVFVDLEAHAGDTSELVDTIAHESVHAASLVLTQAGQEHDGNAEHYAYLVGWTAGRVWDAIAGQ